MRYCFGALLALVVCLGVLGLVPHDLQAQAPPAPPAPTSCEQDVLAQYRQLVTDQQIPTETLGATAGSWQGQLTAISTELRVIIRQFNGQLQKALTAENQTARLAEQVRQLRQREMELMGALEQAKKDAAEKPAP
jgi:nitric oxide reductase large subunit